MAKKRSLYSRASKYIKPIGRQIYKRTGLVNPIKKGNVSLTRVIKDVNILKSVVNAEKKRFHVTTSSAQQFGQVGGNASGHYIADITPLVPQGSGNAQRNGSSIKPHSMYAEFQMFHQPSTVAKQKIVIEVFRVLGIPLSSMTTAAGQIFNPNQFVYNQNASNPYIIDLQSSRDQDYFKDFQLLARKTITLDPDQFTGQSVVKYVKLGMKFKNEFHIKYNDDTTTPTSGQIIMTIRCDNGNANGSTASTLTGIPITSVNTGVYMNYDITYYYYDN